MTRWRQWLGRLWAHVRAGRLDREFDQELESHVALSTDDYVRAGLSEDAARRKALLDVGGATSLAEQHRSVRGLPVLDVMQQDLRDGLRVLRHRPAFAWLAILTVALGVGATTTLFSVAYGVLLKPLPYPAEQRLVRLSETRQGGTVSARPFLSRPTFDAWQQHMTTLEGLAGWNAESVTVTIQGGSPERRRIVTCTASLFAVLQTYPVVGTVFGTDAETPGNDRSVLIDYATWQGRFGGSADVVGRTVEIEGETTIVIGVMSRGFHFPDATTSMWKPLDRTKRLVTAVGRLKDAATVDQAADEGTARSRTAPDMGSLGTAIFGSNGPSRVTATPLRQAVTATIRPGILLAFTAGLILIVVATLNVAGVQLARAIARQKEFAIRAAIGAGGGRIARQVLVENAIIGIAGGLCGLVLAVWLNSLLPKLGPQGMTRLEDVSMDWHVLLFMMALTIAVSIVCGLLPATLAHRVRMLTALADDGRAPASGGLRTRVSRTRWLLLAGQAAMAAALLTGASLVARSFVAVLAADRGYEPHGILTARLPLPAREFSKERRVVVLDEIIARLTSVPGVTHAAATDILPLIDLEFPRSFAMPPPGGTNRPVTVQVMSRTVSRDYFATLGMRVIDGRGFGDADTRESLPAMVVNRTFVQRYLGGRSAVGVTVPIRWSATQAARVIIGVVDDVRQHRAADPPQPEAFACYCQIPEGLLTDIPAIAARTAADPLAYAGTLRDVVHDVAPTASLDSIATMNDRLDASVSGLRTSVTLFAAFGVFAVLLVGIGLFGTLSYNVVQRARELSVRVALGAQSTDVLRVVAGPVVVALVCGMAVGIPTALAAGRYFREFLFGVTTFDIVTVVAVTGVLLIVTIAASLLPAVRAIRSDPIQALRSS
jgi:predicted permease